MKHYFTPYICILFFLAGILTSYTQKIELKIVAKDTINNSILDAISFKQFHRTKKDVFKESDSISNYLQKVGFINTYVERIQEQDSLYTATFFLGENSKIIIIKYNSKSISKENLRAISINASEHSFEISIDEVPSTLNKLVNLLEANGNSFAEASLKNIFQSENNLFADLYINKTLERKIDAISINGYTNFPKTFLKHHLSLKKETVFNTEKLKFASNAIQSLPFVSEIKPPEILFAKDSTVVYLYLKKNKSNRFDGLIGFSSDENGKLNFNGYLDLVLSNVFNKGETFSINWRSNGNDRKLFNISIETPYIFNTAITPKASFNIYKQDSTFLNIRALVDLSYAVNAQHSVSAKFQSEKSNDLTNSTLQNGISEYSNTFYGASYTFRKVDSERPFQYKSFLNFNALWGNRTLTSENKKERQQKYELTASYNWTLNQKNSIFIKNNTALLLSNELFTNELYRIGGANSIRGFDEESIFSSIYSILNLEYRYHLANRSYLYSITDFAYTLNAIQNNETQLYSFGLGYTYAIKSGIIDISYAIGKRSKLPFDFNNSRFHIKLIQLF